MLKKKSLLKSATIISAMTLISRLLGLARDIVTANFFGTTMAYDCFILAFTLPNFLKNFISEGVLNASFIPVFIEYSSTQRRQIALDISRTVFYIIFFSTLVLTLSLFVLLFFLSKNVMFSEKTNLTLYLIQWMLPAIFFNALCSILIAILNAHRQFFLSSLSPILLNVFWIFSFFILCPLLGKDPNEKILGLVLGIGLSLFVQCLFYIRSCRTLGFQFFPISLSKESLAVKKIKTLAIPVIGIFAMNHLNGTIDILWAHSLGSGIQSALWYAQRIIYCPLGVFVVAMSVAILPQLSEQVQKKQTTALRDTVLYGLKLIISIIIPCTLFIFLMKKEIVSLLFERGQFDSLSVRKTAIPLTYYSLGLFFFAVNKFFLAVYYSFRDTKTPLIAAFYSVLTNILLNALFIPFLQHGGLALASSLSAILMTVLLTKGLLHKINSFLDKQFLNDLLKIVCITICTGFVNKVALTCVGLIPLKEPFFKFAIVFFPLTISSLFLLCFYAIFQIFDPFVHFKKNSSVKSK